MSHPESQYILYPLQAPDAINNPLAPGQQLGQCQNVNPAMISAAPGVPYYTSTYTPLFRPRLLPNAPGIINSMAQVIQPQITGEVEIPSVTPVEKPKTTVFVGNIASTVENNFVLKLLGLCGPVKSWKRLEDHVSQKYKKFGLCEFANDEGVQRSLRLLNKLNIDGQELMLKMDNKFESVKNIQETNNAKYKEEGDIEPSSDNSTLQKPLNEVTKKELREGKIDTTNYGIVSDEDKQSDLETMEKLNEMAQLRLKRNISLPPPLPATDGLNSSSWKKVAESECGFQIDDIINWENKTDKKRASRQRLSTYKEKLERSLADKKRQIERKIRLRGIELERYERIIEKGRTNSEKICMYRDKKYEDEYRRRLKISEGKRKMEEERDKEREYARAPKILEKAKESDDGNSKRPKYKIGLVDNIRREKECDLADIIKEEEEAELEEGEIAEESDFGDHHYTEIGDDFEFMARRMGASDIQQNKSSLFKKLGCEEEETSYIHKHFKSLDQIPMSKKELFSYKISTDVCDKECVGSSANAAKSIPNHVIFPELGVMDNLNLSRSRLCFCIGKSFICKYCAPAMNGKITGF